MIDSGVWRARHHRNVARPEAGDLQPYVMAAATVGTSVWRRVTSRGPRTLVAPKRSRCTTHSPLSRMKNSRTASPWLGLGLGLGLGSGSVVRVRARDRARARARVELSHGIALLEAGE